MITDEFKKITVKGGNKMERSEEIVLEIIKELYPEWIRREREQYGELQEYEQFKIIFQKVFHYDIRKACGERDHAMDYTELVNCRMK